MNGRNFAGVAAVALGTIFTGTLALSQSQAPSAKPKSPDWFLAGSPQTPGGRLSVGPGGRVAASPGGPVGGAGGLLACASDTAKFCTGQTGLGARSCLTQNSDKLSGQCKAELAAIPVTSARS